MVQSSRRLQIEDLPTNRDITLPEHTINVGANIKVELPEIILRAGEITLITGPNGAGKTKIMGAIVESLRQTNPTQRLFYAYQNYNEVIYTYHDLFSNVTLDLRKREPTSMLADFNRIAQELNELKFEHLIEDLRASDEFKQDKWIQHLKLPRKNNQRTVASFSGGEKQILLLLRIIFLECKYLCLDEPDSALDYEHSMLFWKRLEAYVRASNSVTCVITHNLPKHWISSNHSTISGVHGESILVSSYKVNPETAL